MAPEVVLSGRVGKPADVYAFGILLWELQHGERPPWRRGQRLPTFPSLNTAELAFRPDCPAAYVALAQRCLHGSKDLRPTMAVVADALAALQLEVAASLPSELPTAAGWPGGRAGLQQPEVLLTVVAQQSKQ